MILDEMSAPLGQNRPARRAKLPLPFPTLIRCALAALVLTFTAWAMTGNDAQEPAAPKVDAARAGNEEADRLATQAAAEQPKVDSVAMEKLERPATRTITIIDGTSGKRQEIVIPAPPEDDTRMEQPKSPNSVRPKSKSESRASLIPAQAGIR